MSPRPPFTFADRVRFADLDARGHLNNVAFLAIVDAARNAFLRHVDPSYDPTAPGARDLILVRTEID
jgi:acyl-CoA thioesterase FadM